MSEPVFTVRDAGVVRDGRTLVDGLSLTVARGEVLVVLGENGAGKSTLLRLLAGDFPPDRGDVELDGRPVARWSAREQARRRAVLTQQPSMAFAFTALDVVLLGRSPHDRGRPGAADRAIARDALARTDALQFANRRYPTLSGGERARVMLARAFAQVARDGADDAGPRALLLDEPTAALDIAHRHAALTAIRSVAHDNGVAAVVVLHDVNLAAVFADRVALIKGGRLRAVGPVSSTMTEEALGDCYSLPMRRVDVPDAATPLFVPVAGRAPLRPT